jgi:hypothetical protein
VLAIFVPARAEDLALSFAAGVDSAAHGAILYRNAASRYAALAAGTAGRALVTGGAGADPSWALLDHGAALPPIWRGGVSRTWGRGRTVI